MTIMGFISKGALNEKIRVEADRLARETMIQQKNEAALKMVQQDNNPVLKVVDIVNQLKINLIRILSAQFGDKSFALYSVDDTLYIKIGDAIHIGYGLRKLLENVHVVSGDIKLHSVQRIQTESPIINLPDSIDHNIDIKSYNVEMYFATKKSDEDAYYRCTFLASIDASAVSEGVILLGRSKHEYEITAIEFNSCLNNAVIISDDIVLGDYNN